MRSRVTLLTLAVALAAGVLIGFVDSRPTWDDTAITAGSVFLCAGILGAARPRVAWLSGLAVGAPVPVLNAVLNRNLGSAAAVGIGLIGAGAGYLIGRALASGRAPRSA
jgi:hypothetical protein